MLASPSVRNLNGSTTSLIFPMYNPGPLIESTWKALTSFLSWAPGNWEVVFVCDGCTDGTAQRLTALIGSENLPVRQLSYTPNRGKGYAVRQGLLAATGQWRMFTDVDLAYGFEDVVRLARTLQGGAAVAIGSRIHPESRIVAAGPVRGYVFRRHLQSRVFSALVRRLLPIQQQDTQAGLKGLSAQAAQTIVPLLECDGFGFDCELLTACARLGVAVTEVPVCVRYESKESTTNLGTMFRMMGEIWKIRRAWRKLPGPVPKVQALANGKTNGQHFQSPRPLPLFSRGIS
jgi:dolichyl-phosphate beta-glucosyltransferase